jgi:hypothetical protein
VTSSIVGSPKVLPARKWVARRVYDRDDDAAGVGYSPSESLHSMRVPVRRVYMGAVPGRERS